MVAATALTLEMPLARLMTDRDLAPMSSLIKNMLRVHLPFPAPCFYVSSAAAATVS